MGAHGVKEGSRGEEEDPCVPGMSACGEHRGGPRGIGFFDKAAQGQGGGALWHAVQFQPAIACLGARGDDAEGHDAARTRGGHASGDSRAEGACIRDQVV